MTDDAAEVTAGGAEEADDLGENRNQAEYPELCEAWVVKAWELWVGGVKNWSAIAQQVGRDRHTVRKHVTRYSETLAALLTGTKVNPLAEYIQGVYQDLGHQTQIALKAERVFVDSDGKVERVPDFGTQSRARKEVTECRKLIASAVGVVTERKGVQHSGDAANPVQFVIGVLPAADVDAVLAEIGATDDGPPDAAD